ncbi:MAG: hypothetical protein H0T47_10425 [Planctomycetaceae bacterium]|nr:hypothetical protein [Planctomycetaceae bacterium]
MRFRLCTVVLGVFHGMNLILGIADAAATPVPPEIWEAFTARQEAADSAEVRWTTQKMQGAALIEQMKGNWSPEAASLQGDVPIPPAACRMVLWSALVRYESQEALLAQGKAQELRPSINAYDGRRLQTLQDSVVRGGQTTGFVKDAREFDEWRNIHLAGLMANLRPLRIFGRTPAEWTLEARPEVIDGRSCVVIVQRETDKLSRRIYLDSERDFVPLRIQSEREDSVYARSDMRYERTEEPRWVPSSWTASFSQGGRLLTQTDNELTDVRLGLPVPKETFTVEYPKGALLTVVDGKGDRVMVVADDGEWVPYRQAAAEATANFGWPPWAMFLAGIGVAALAVALLQWRRQSVTSKLSA